MSEKKRVALKLLEIHPERSNSQIAKDTGLSHPTVASVRAGGEQRGLVEKSSTMVDARGHRQSREHKRPKSKTLREFAIACLTSSNFRMGVT